jgi:hypothetical protein
MPDEKMKNDKSAVQKFKEFEQFNSSNSVSGSGSTFAEVRLSKTAPIQAMLDRQLPKAIGNYFALVDARYEEKPNYSNPDQITHATIYSVRIVSKSVWIDRGTELHIKIKDSKPIISDKELDEIMFGEHKPIILSFNNLSYYHFNGGESLLATGVQRVDNAAGIING